MIEIMDMLQGSPEWYQARLGIATASEFGSVMAKGRGGKGDGQTRGNYMRRLAAETLLGKPIETYSNHHMRRGQELEPQARHYYAGVYEVEPQLVGFVRDGDVGCSPDAFLGDDGILEIKTKLPDLVLEMLPRDEPPKEFMPQVQGGLWITGRRWTDLVFFWPGLPMKVFRVERDEDYIADLADEVFRFNTELRQLIRSVRGEPASAVLREQLEASLV